MHISDFDYELPKDLIAREPARPRDAARMMVLNRKTGLWSDSTFAKLPDFLNPPDVLVLNNTRVIRARLRGRIDDGRRPREVEVFFAAPVGAGAWEVLCRPGRRIRHNDRVVFAEGELEGIFGESRAHGLRVLHLNSSNVDQFLNVHGHVPLPPYLEREDTPIDSVDYQTVYADLPGAVAAPTAGLHFTQPMIESLRTKGIDIVTITLHVGIGTFLPIRTDDPEKHVLKPERFEVSADAASRLNAAIRDSRRIVAVGTTTTRTLEYVVGRYGRFERSSGEADLFILPGHEFKAVSAILTNFHLPKSTLLMLVAAFASRALVMEAYRHAVDARYRFYSYGDCMLLT
jgi:S-adenosylmethionine:tRNA ribosyltransferase-isomerase